MGDEKDSGPGGEGGEGHGRIGSESLKAEVENASCYGGGGGFWAKGPKGRGSFGTWWGRGAMEKIRDGCWRMWGGGRRAINEFRV